jgi:hypothetical protein
MSEHSLAVVFGLPSAVTLAIAEMLLTIARVARQDSFVTEVDSLQGFEVACATGQPFVAVSQFPSMELLKHLDAELVPEIVISADPMRSVAHVLRDQSEVGAVRSVSASISCLFSKLTQHGSEIQERNAKSLAVFFKRTAALVGAECNGAHSDRIDLQAIELAERFAGMCVRQSVQQLPANSLWPLAAAALPTDFLHSGGRVEVTWPGRLFLLGDFPDTWMQGPIDISGPARCLLYGPYLHLPAGHWNVQLVIGVAGHDGRQAFVVEVVCAEVVAKGSFSIEGSGLFEIEMDFVHRDPNTPLEIRLFLDVGAIYGWVSRFEVSLCCATSSAGQRSLS